MAQMGRPAKISAADYDVLRALVKERPLAPLAELAAQFQARTGITVHPVTLGKALTLAGVQRIKGTPGATRPVAADGQAARYGYHERHRPAWSEETYPTSLTDAEWALVRDLFEPEGQRGVPPRISRRALLDACCYVVRTGCAWRLLPNDLPHWDNVYKTFRRWHAQGKFEAMHDRLRGLWRARAGRDEAPHVGILDAQSTRTSPQGGPAGFDAGKKVKGRKRNLIVDALGLLLAVTVTAASLQDRDAGTAAVARAAEQYPTVERRYADSAYAGPWAATVTQTHGIAVEIVRHPANRNVGRWVLAGQTDLFPDPPPPGFIALPMRWIVERTHAWNERAHRLIMHHDRLTTVSEAWVWLAEARLLAMRLTG